MLSALAFTPIVSPSEDCKINSGLQADSINSPKIGGVSTWLYRSYLKGMKYNLNCYRKEWNRVWDIDLALRIYHAGVKMGFLEEVVAFVLPRPGEDSIGLDAYKLTKNEKMKKYKFK